MRRRIHNSVFLPPEKQGQVQFLLFKGLSYTTRMRWFILLAAAGLLT
ncbi:MAG: hypothetical protein GX197_08810 [Firmicutes bacterium]|nr:hypothetical protein [Bacillota bacterium]